MMNAIRIDKKDNVVVAIEYISKNDDINYLEGQEKKVMKSLDDIRIYHKIANRDIKKGEYVIKYGEHIGKASKDIKLGEHVHTHNVEDSRENLREREGDI